MLAPATARSARRVPAGIALAALVLPGGLLSGCGGDSTDTAQQTASASPTSASPTPTSSSSPAPQPPTASKNTAKAREAFARYVVDAWSYALRTNQPGLVTDLSQKKQLCKGCGQFRTELAQRRKDGWYVDFPGTDVQKVVVKPFSGRHASANAHLPKTYSAHAVVDIPASRSYFDDGSFRNVNDAHPNAPFDVLMTYLKGKYALLEFQVG
jgi:hypothetical protein